MKQSLGKIPNKNYLETKACGVLKVAANGKFR